MPSAYRLVSAPRPGEGNREARQNLDRNPDFWILTESGISPLQKIQQILLPFALGWDILGHESMEANLSSSLPRGEICPSPIPAGSSPSQEVTPCSISMTRICLSSFTGGRPDDP